jgi:hypothetical protein
MGRDGERKSSKRNKRKLVGEVGELGQLGQLISLWWKAVPLLHDSQVSVCHPSRKFSMDMKTARPGEVA